jgi:hypothetical protein
MLPPVLLAPSAQIRLNVIGADSFEPDPTLSYVSKEIAGSVRVVRSDRKGEISLPHMLTQCDERVIAVVLLGNAGSPGGSLLRLRKGQTGFVFMRSKPDEKRCRHAVQGHAHHKSLLRIIAAGG